VVNRVNRVNREGRGEFSVAATTDAALIAKLVREAWHSGVDPRSSGHHFTIAAAEQLLQSPGAVALLARDQSGAAVGSVVLVASGDTVELMKLAVPLQRSRGVGAALVDAADRWAEEQDASRIVLAVSAYQPQLVNYYARHGYVVDPTCTYEHASPTSPAPIVMVKVLVGQPIDDQIGRAATALTHGHLVVLPTETVYGLGALASDPIAVRRVFATKGRPVDHPLIVHVANGAAIDEWARDVPPGAHALAAAFWPGPLTIVLPKHPDVLSEVTGGLGTVAVRVPNHPVTLAVLGTLPRGAGIAAPSANRFGKVSPTTAEAAQDLCTYMLPNDLILDGGPCRVGVESTIVDLTTDVPTILRPGGISAEQIESVLGVAVEREASGPSRAPGMLAAHYAPRAGVRLATVREANEVMKELLTQHERVGMLGPASLTTPAGVERLEGPMEYTGEYLAPILYARLRDADTLELDVLVVIVPNEEGIGWAVADRLRRAAYGSARSNSSA
jgi:L-threonylcarbamoyladenylate synthase